MFCSGPMGTSLVYLVFTCNTGRELLAVQTVKTTAFRIP